MGTDTSALDGTDTITVGASTNGASSQEQDSVSTNTAEVGTLNIMSSFDRASLECSCCEESSKILEKRVLARHVDRRTFIITDQHFIAMAPSTVHENHQNRERLLVGPAQQLQGSHNGAGLGSPCSECHRLGLTSANVGTAVYAEELMFTSAFTSCARGQCTITSSPAHFS